MPTSPKIRTDLTYLHAWQCFMLLLKDLNRLSEPEHYDHIVYKLKKIVGTNNFSAQFII